MLAVLRKEMKSELTFLIRPSGKDYLWGGRRLNDDFEKNQDVTIGGNVRMFHPS